MFLFLLSIAGRFCIRTHKNLPPCVDETATPISFITEIEQFYDQIYLEIKNDESNPVTLLNIAKEYQIVGTENTVLRIPLSFNENVSLSLKTLTVEIVMEKPSTIMLKYNKLSLFDTNFIVPEHSKCKLFANSISCDFTSITGVFGLISDNIVVYPPEEDKIPTKNSLLFSSDMFQSGNYTIFCPSTDIDIDIRYSSVEVIFKRTGASMTFFSTSYSKFLINCVNSINIKCAIDQTFDTQFRTLINFNLENTNLTMYGIEKRTPINIIKMVNSTLNAGSGLITTGLVLLEDSKLNMLSNKVSLVNLYVQNYNVKIDSIFNDSVIYCQLVNIFYAKKFRVNKEKIKIVSNSFTIGDFISEDDIGNWVILSEMSLYNSSVVFNSLTIFCPMIIRYTFNGRTPVTVLDDFYSFGVPTCIANVQTNGIKNEDEDKYVGVISPLFVTNKVELTNATLSLYMDTSGEKEIMDNSTFIKKFYDLHSIGIVMTHKISTMNVIVHLDGINNCTKSRNCVNLNEEDPENNNKWIDFVRPETKSISLMIDDPNVHNIHINLDLLKYPVEVTLINLRSVESSHVIIHKTNDFALPKLDLIYTSYEMEGCIKNVEKLCCDFSTCIKNNISVIGTNEIRSNLEDVIKINSENSSIVIFIESDSLSLLLKNESILFDRVIEGKQSIADIPFSIIEKNSIVIKAPPIFNCFISSLSVEKTIPKFAIDLIDAEDKIDFTFCINKSLDQYLGKPFIFTKSITSANIKYQSMNIPLILGTFGKLNFKAENEGALDFLELKNFELSGKIELYFQTDDPVSFQSPVFKGDTTEITINEEAAEVILKDPIFEAKKSFITNLYVSGLVTLNDGVLSARNSDFSNSNIFISNPDDAMINILTGTRAVVPPRQIIIKPFKGQNKAIIKFNQVSNITDWLSRIVSDDKNVAIEKYTSESVVYVSVREKLTASEKKLIYTSIGVVISIVIVISAIAACICYKKDKYTEYKSEENPENALHENLLSNAI